MARQDDRQRGRVWRAVAAAALAAGCAGAPGPPAGGPGAGDLSAAVRRTAPEPGDPGCWHREDRPAVFETVSRQRLAPGGQVVTETRQSLVRPRETIWFAVPCGEPTPAFAASVQRALKARGLFAQPVTGTIDAATRAAIRRYQAARGLDSGTLSLAAARALGLVPAEGG